MLLEKVVGQFDVQDWGEVAEDVCVQGGGAKRNQGRDQFTARGRCKKSSTPIPPNPLYSPFSKKEFLGPETL